MGGDQMAVRRLIKEYKKIEENPVKNILALPNPSNILVWHFILYNLDDPQYKDGVYHGKILFPKDYPMKAPDIVFTTPNGRFEIGKKICLSFTSYHPESWIPNWCVESMLVGLISFWHTEEPTTGGMRCSSSKRKAMAKESLSFNMNDRVFMEVFGEKLESLKIDIEKAEQLEMEAKEMNASEVNNMVGFLGVALGIIGLIVGLKYLRMI